MRGIIVNKGRIHREIRYFREIFWKMIKLDNELVMENMKNGRFRRITQRRIHGIKNHSIWISNCEEIKERREMKFSKAEEHKTKRLQINDEIKLNYDPKIQMDDT